MSYDNAEPKVLKTLNSSGQVLDDAGNVISDTTSYWEKKYVEAEPKPDKILKSDGSVVDSEGNQIQATNAYNVKKYNQAEPIPAKYLHADGTIDENAGGADLENDHQTTIDVSTYTQPVAVTPISGKDGMKKNTVTLTNIPSMTLYAWRSSGDNPTIIYTLTENPISLTNKAITGYSDGVLITKIIQTVTITPLSSQITIDSGFFVTSYQRYSVGDISM